MPKNLASILTVAQAAAVYDAMCHLNNVSARAHIRLPDASNDGLSMVHVVEYEDNTIRVFVGDAIGNPLGCFEFYTSQDDFHHCYLEA